MLWLYATGLLPIPRLGLFSRVDGSAYFEQGNTKVIAVVYGPREVPRGWRPLCVLVVAPEALQC
jgi:hypothetical protein